ncbi:MAG: SbcC/MukB-like Walker B domain-containing protein [Candidatus Kapaibacterium sp.]
MRPISLEISGLQSFRERRVIDFEPLLRDNLFGIFGQTGSGKSTILDGMTLALFGKVERTKGRSIASAINSSSTDCAVAFRFEIEQNGVRERYLVERSYKVRKSGMKSDARLIRESDDPPLPLADKASEVDDTLNKIIGIKAEDFARAVVLPQGAFAEFLKMTPGDRGTMLQRIFGLEDLGNRINNRLSELRRSVEKSRTGFEERLTLLSEYNDEALLQSEKEFAVSEEELSRSKGKFDKVQTQLKQSEELYQLILEREKLLAGEEERGRGRTRLVELQKILQDAERALELEGVVEKVESIEKRWRDVGEELQRIAAEKERGGKNLEGLEARRKRAEEWRENELPRLERQLEVLKGVVDIDARIGEIEESLKERKKRLEVVQRERETLLRDIGEASGEEEKIRKEREALKEKPKALQGEIDKLTTQSYALERLEALATARDERESRLEALRKEENELQVNLEENLKALAKRREEESANQKERDEAEQRLERGRQENVLAGVSHMLVEGEPCPLCGSVEHPHPHSNQAAADLTALREALTAAEKHLKETITSRQALERDEATFSSSLQSLKKRRGEVEEELNGILEEVERVTIESEYKGGTEREVLVKWRGKIGDQLAAKRAEKDQLEERLLALDAGLTKAQSILSEGKAKEEGLAVQIREIESELQREEREMKSQMEKRENELAKSGVQVPVGQATSELEGRASKLEGLRNAAAEVEKTYAELKEGLVRVQARYEEYRRSFETEEKNRAVGVAELERRLREAKFESLEDWRDARLPEAKRESLRRESESLGEEIRRDDERLTQLKEKIGEGRLTAEEIEAIRTEAAEANRTHDRAMVAFGEVKKMLETCRTKNAEWKEAQRESERVEREQAAITQLSNHLRGNAFINYLADEQLRHICRTASTQLHQLTNGRLEVDVRGSEGFIVRDFGNGGIERPTSSLSGGETFLVSLSLALALSESLQLRGTPLEFFFLDEGFGTLDAELLDTVMDALDRLRANSHRAIGVISHVESLQERIPRKLMVTPATAERGSDVRIEG